MTQMDQVPISLFDGLETPNVSDALDKLGLVGQCLGIAPLGEYRKPVVGPAFTVQCGPIGDAPNGIASYLDEVPAKAIVVIDNGGRIDCSTWGDLITEFAIQHAFAGTVIDGVCRDVSKALGEGYPIFSRGRYMRTGKGRVDVLATQVPVSISQVPVCPQDLIVADINGVVVVPRAQARDVARVAHEIAAVEARMRTLVVAGRTLAQARRELSEPPQLLGVGRQDGQLPSSDPSRY